MRVNGFLEEAQFENVAALGTAGKRGRVKTLTTDAIPYYDNGTLWRPFRLGQTTPLIAVTVTNNVATVNWANGLNQRVVLTAATRIDFQNPVAGEIHTLIIQQAVADPIFGYTLNMIDQATDYKPYQATDYIVSGTSRVLQWFYSPAVQAAKTAVATLIAPTTAPTSAQSGLSISAEGTMLAMGVTVSPFLNLYPIFEKPNPGLIVSNPFGPRNYVTPATATASVTGTVFSPSGDNFFLASGTTPFIQGFFLDRETPVGSAFANPGVLPAGAATCVNIHPSGGWVGVGHATTPFLSIYPINGSAFGTKITDPAVLPTAQVNYFAWSPTGDYIAAACRTTPFIRVWGWNALGNGSFSSVIANPSPLPADGPIAGGHGIAWRPQGDYIAMAMETTPFLYVVGFNRNTGTFGSVLSVPIVPSAALKAVAWSPCGSYLYVAKPNNPGIVVYDFSALSLGSTGQISTSATVTDVVVHPSGQWVFGATNTTAIEAWNATQRVKNYMRLIP